MKKMLIGIGIIILGIIALFIALIFHRAMWSGDAADCQTFDPAGAESIVREDYLKNRLPRWKHDRQQLATLTPELHFGAGQNGGTGGYMLPFSVESAQAKIHYSAIVDCKYGSVEYSRLDK